MTPKVNFVSAPTFSQVGGIAALAFAALIFLPNAAILAPAGMPHPGADLDDVTAFFGAGPGPIDLTSHLLPGAWLAATVFAAAVVAAARGVEREHREAWSLVGLAGVLLQNLNIAAVSALRLTLAHHDVEDAVALWTMHEALFGLNGTFLALALLGCSLAGRRAGLLRRWHVALGLAAGALQFTSASLTPLVMAHGGRIGWIGLAGWLLWVAWIICYGIALIRAGNTAGRRRRGM